MSEGLAKNHISFYIGDKSLFLEKEEKKMMNGKIKLLDFISLFNNPEDRYFAISVFEEKLLLSIKKSTAEDFNFFNFYIHDKDFPLYNLSVLNAPDFLLKRWHLLNV